MKVAQLLTELQALDPDMEVLCIDRSYSESEYFGLESVSLDKYMPKMVGLELYPIEGDNLFPEVEE